MTTYQTFNRRIMAWVKYEFTTGKAAKILDVKENEPMKKFKGVPVRSIEGLKSTFKRKRKSVKKGLKKNLSRATNVRVKRRKGVRKDATKQIFFS